MLCISVRLMAIDNTIVNVALPTLNRRINASTADLQWIVTAYSLLFAALLLMAGHLSGRVGRKRMLVGLDLHGEYPVVAAGCSRWTRGSRWPPACRKTLSPQAALTGLGSDADGGGAQPGPFGSKGL